MSTRTRAEAHKHFGNLYRKKRDEEHQKKVDEILAKTSDIYIRIDLIEKLDKDYLGGERKYDLVDEREKSRPNRKAMDETAAKDKKTQPKPSQTNHQSGILGGIFGGSNQEIVQFARDTHALEVSLLTRKPSIAPDVKKVFRGINEDRIISTITTLNHCEKVGWKYWNHKTYNIIVNFKRFFTSFISLDSLFMDEISPEVFLEKSMKMQMYYIRHLEIPDAKQIILNHITPLIQKSKSLSQRRIFIQEGLNYALTLEERKPRLTDCICAFHIIKHKKLLLWNDIKKLLRVPAITYDKFAAPPTIASQIQLSVKNVENKIRDKLLMVKDAEELKTRYFEFGKNGKMKYEFLYHITDDYLQSYHNEPQKVVEMRKSYLTNPHKLLHLLCRDLQSTYFGVIEGFLKLQGKASEDIQIFNPELFFYDMEKINYLIRNLDEFNRKYSSFQYSFKDFTRHMAKTKTSNDQIENDVLKLISKVSKQFTTLGRKCNVVVNNHLNALEHSDQETLLAEKNKPIDNFKIIPRYIPYFDGKVKTDGRVNGYTVYQLFWEMTKLFLNYAAIFRDSTIMQELSVNRKVEGELKAHHAEYRRLTGYDYRPIEKEKEEIPIKKPAKEEDES